MSLLLFVEAFGQILHDENLERVVSDEDDLYSIFLSRSEMMGWSTMSAHCRPMLWAMHEAEFAAGIDASRIGWVQVGLDVGDFEPARPSSAPVQGWAYAPLAVHRRDIEPALALPALIQCFHDALRRFGIVELSGLQVTANFLDPRTQPWQSRLYAMLNWFNATLKGKADALIAFDEEFLGGHTEAELVTRLQRMNTGAFEFGPVVAVPEQYSIRTGIETPIHRISPASSGLGISVTLPEWTPSAAGWALAIVVDAARLIKPDVNNFAVRVTRVR